MAIVNVGSNGKAAPGLPIGTTVKTAGGNFVITGVKSDGSYISTPGTNSADVVKSLTTSPAPSVTQTIQQTKTGGSSGAVAVEQWQVNMQKTYEGGAAAIASEIARAQNVLYSGAGTAATYRYLSQMNALKDGASLSDVFAGKYDGYQGQGQNWNLQKNIENQEAAKIADQQMRITERYGGVAGVSGLPGGAGADVVGRYDDPYDNNTVSQAVSQGMSQMLPDMSGAIMVFAGAAVLMAVAKLFGK